VYFSFSESGTFRKNSWESSKIRAICSLEGPGALFGAESGPDDPESAPDDPESGPVDPESKLELPDLATDSELPGRAIYMNPVS
jgi:hypothetical protein